MIEIAHEIFLEAVKNAKLFKPSLRLMNMAELRTTYHQKSWCSKKVPVIFRITFIQFQHFVFILVLFDFEGGLFIRILARERLRS